MAPLLVTLLAGLLLTSATGVKAQRLTDTTAVDFSRYRGSLIAINEMHGVSASKQVYLHFLKKLAASCGPGDTINLMLEIPYSLARLQQAYLTSGAFSALFRDSSLQGMIRSAGLPVRIFGCDFEYDRGGIRAESYQIFLGESDQRLTSLGMDATPLSAYVVRLRKDSVWQELTGRKALINIVRRQHATATNPEAKSLLREVWFVLTAVQHIHGHRDRAIYRRMLEATDAGLIHAQGRFNFLVHGGTHLEPGWKGSLFHYLDARDASPFRDQTFLIAQAYLDCHSKGDYFHPNADYIWSSLLFTKYGKRQNAFVEWFRQRIAAGAEPNTIFTLKQVDYPEPALVEHGKKVLVWTVLNRCF